MPAMSFRIRQSITGAVMAGGRESIPAASAGTLNGGLIRLTSLTPLEWLICGVACLGFLFDAYEFTVWSVAARPALATFGLEPGTAEFNRWVGLQFYLPFAAGGIFGLLGGYLTDWFGRRRVLVWSILLYGVSAAGAAVAPSIGALLFWRCLAIVGACVEFVTAVAWLAELFPQPRRREAVLGYTHAFAGLAGFLIAAVYYIAVTYAGQLPLIAGGHDAWRYTLLLGLLPAIPLAVIRPFLPESPAWQLRARQSTSMRPRLTALFQPRLRRTTLVATLLTACSYAVAVGVIQQVPRVVPGIPEVRQLGAIGLEQTISGVHLFTASGNLLGRLLFALLVTYIVSQRRLLRIFLLPAFAITPAVYALAPHSSLAFLQLGELAAMTLMAAQLSFWGNYLPRLYPTHLRATGESFATNVGGRLIGTSVALVTTRLAGPLPGIPPVQLAYAMACVAAFIYAIAIATTRLLQEPAHAQLPD